MSWRKRQNTLRKKTMQELLNMQEKLSEKKAQGHSNFNLYDKKIRQKLSDIAWAIQNKLEEKA